MADVNYSNPFSQLPTTQQYNISTPYGTYNTPLGTQAGNTQLNAAMPSVGMALQGQAMDLSKQQTQLQEFQGSEATDQRRQERLAATRKSILEAAKSDQEFSRLPQVDQVERAKLADQYAQIQAKPEGEMVADLAKAYPAMRDAKSDMERALIHKQIADRWQRKYPGMQLPPGLANYSPDTLSVGRAGFQAELHSAAHEADLEKVGVQERAATQRAGIAAGAGIQEAQIAQKGAAERQTQQLQYGPQRQGQLRQVIASPTATAEQKASANVELADMYHDPVMKSVVAQTQGDVNFMQYSTAKQSAVRTRMYIQEMNLKGIKLPISVWRQSMPGATDAEIKEMAKKQGIEISGY